MTPGIVPPYLLARIATAAEPRFARAAAAAARTLAIPRPPRRVRSRLRLSIEESGTLVVETSPAPDRVVSDAQNREQLPGVRVRGEDDPATDRKSVVSGTSVSVRVDLGGCRIFNTKKLTITTYQT